ncbi:hypothetical protein H9P43_001019 [Blastocladiella emersonii ATCC 22665]|nr:hypothetical protein H9P43_001019 [Blastocladiella emersonii ATCC 22665]
MSAPAISSTAKTVGIALGVIIPCLGVGYFLRDSAPASVQLPNPASVAAAAAAPPRASESAPSRRGPAMDPVAAMSLEECRGLLERTETLHHNALRERQSLLAKIANVEARQRQSEAGSA